MKIFSLRTTLAINVVAVYCAALGGAHGAPGTDAALLSASWPPDAGNELRASLLPGMGFSFTYDDQPVGPAYGPAWELRQEGLVTTLRHASGLTVIRTARVFEQYGAIEYTVVFRNDSAKELPALTDLKALDLSFSRPAGAVDVVTRCGGGEADPQFPPGPAFDFTLTRTELAVQSQSLSLSADRGRSSRLVLPFFYLQNQAQDAGLYVGLGWSGQWRSSISADPERHRLHLEGGIADVNLLIPTPGSRLCGPKQNWLETAWSSICRRCRQVFSYINPDHENQPVKIIRAGLDNRVRSPGFSRWNATNCQKPPQGGTPNQRGSGSIYNPDWIRPNPAMTRQPSASC